MRLHAFTLLSLLGLVPSLVNASLSGSVGPLTSASAKAAKKTCNVLDYGAKADQKTDLGPPLAAAFAACKSGGLVYIPAGNYAMSTWVKLADGKAWALQIDGVIYRTGTGGGNMIMIERASDFELFSSTSSGAMQGLGYEFHVDNNWSGPRLLRLWDVSDFSVHDLILVDSPSFHFSLDTCSNGEVYNMAVRGGNHGGLDGIDVWSTNIWIHDVEVTNKDECVTVKVCSSDINILVCLIKNIYTWKSNNMMLIKSNGGSGTVSNVVFENFIGHGNAYSLDIDSYWSSMSAVAGNGVELSNITVKNWKGTEENGAQRGPIKIICPDKAPCYDIFIEDFAMWTESGSKQWYSCESAYGSGFCLKSGSQHTSYAVTTTTVSSAPSGYSAAKMPLDLTTDFGITKSIPIPTIPTTFYPGATPYSALMSKQSTKAAKARAVDMSIETPAAAGQASPESAGPVPSGTPGPVPTGGNRPSRHHHGHHHSHHPHHSRTAA